MTQIQLQTSLPPSGASYLSTVTIRGSRYEVLIALEDAHGNIVPFSGAIDPTIIQKTISQIENLVELHNKHHTTSSDIIEISSKGVERTDHSKQDHSFFIEPLDAKNAQETADILSQKGKQLTSSAIKAQHIWDNIQEEYILAAQSAPTSSLPASPPTVSPPSPSDPIQPSPATKSALLNETQPPTIEPLAKRAAVQGVVHAAQEMIEALPNWKETDPDWYDKIPDALKLPVYQNIQQGRIGPMEEKFKRRLEQKRDSNLFYRFYVTDSKKMIQAAIETLKERIAKGLDPNKIAAQALLESYYDAVTLLDRLRKRESFKQKLQALPKDPDLYECFYKQAEIDAIPFERTEDWVTRHICDNVDRSMQALQRYVFL